jgi:hypothetical protein
LAEAIRTSGSELTAKPVDERQHLYRDYLRQASEWAEELKLAEPMREVPLDGELGELQYFSIAPDTTLGQLA